MRLLVSALTTLGLVGGYAVAAGTGSRPAGGLVLLAAGVTAGVLTNRAVGGRPTALVGTVYLVSFAGSHALALVTGAWPAVLIAAAVTAATAVLAINRRPAIFERTR